MQCYKWLVYSLVLGLIISLFACEADQGVPAPPNRNAPEIIISNPSNHQLELLGRTPLDLEVNMADDFALERLAVSRSVNDASGNLIESSNPLDMFIEGSAYTLNFKDTLPDLPSFFQIIYTFEVRNTDNQAATTQLFVSIADEPSPSAFNLFSFEGFSLPSQQSGNGYAFNFSLQDFFPPPSSNLLDWDIEEGTLAGSGGIFDAKLSSPNNDLLGQDSVFVMTNASRFNFDAATYETIEGAYLSASNYFAETPTLQAGDLVIIRLIKAPAIQFAVMKIKEVIDDAGTANDQILFDYKVSSR